jgi:hypothetical protein
MKLQYLIIIFGVLGFFSYLLTQIRKIIKELTLLIRVGREFLLEMIETVKSVLKKVKHSS